MGAFIAPVSSLMTDVVSYPKGDLRRMLSVLAAIDSMPDATLVKVVARTGLDKKTVTNLIAQASEQAGVNITKVGPVYTLVNWGLIIKRSGAKMALTGALNAPIIIP
jgi:2-C-methyl-D-erythritol 4-phosphate cytidylyltransferase